MPGPLWHVFTFYYFVFLSYTVWLIRQEIARSSGSTRNQFRYLLIGTLIAFAGASTNFLLWYDIPIPPFGTIVVPFYVVLAALATIRYQFMDIKVAVTQTGILLVTYLVVLGVPFLTGWVGRSWLEGRFGRGWWLVPLGLCTALATAGPFAYAFLRRQAEAALLKEQRRYQKTLQHAARGMTQVRSVAKLANLITRLVSRTVRVTHATLFLWDQTHQRYVLRASHGPRRLSLQSRYALEPTHPLIRWLRERGQVLTGEEASREADASIGRALMNLTAELAIPGMIEHRLVGFLVLGTKRSGAAYSTDDLHAFATLANEAAIAVENAISYEELLKVNEQLKAASERLLVQERQAAAGQFAAGMAHEIKNPLSAIKTFAQFLPEKYADPEFRETFFRIVQQEIERINSLVKELSDFAKPAPLELTPTNVSSLVEDTLSLLSGQRLKQGVDLQTSFNEDGLEIQADPQQLKQVILNLLLNSLEAMPNGGKLQVATEVRGPHLSLRIKDSGCGVAPEDQRSVWDPFFTTKERGMGLGLAIVKGIVERHGGRITLASLPGKGTTVHLSLPLSR